MCYDTKRFRSDCEAWGEDLKFWVRFATRQEQQVTVRVAISSVDPAGARGSLHEIDGLTFDEVRSRGEQLWERELSRFTVEGPQRVKETFYTSAYRCFLSPFLSRMRTAASASTTRVSGAPRDLPTIRPFRSGTPTAPSIR